MSSSGLSTEQESRSSLPGWLEPRRPQVKALPSPPILLKLRLSMRRFLDLTRTVLTTSRFSLLLRQLPADDHTH